MGAKERMAIWVAVMMTLIFSFTTMLMSATSSATQRVVSLDVKAMTQTFNDQLNRMDVDADQKAQMITNYANALGDMTARYADSHHAVLVVKPAIIAGATDITPQFQQAIFTQVGVK